MLVLNQVAMSYGGQELFENVSLNLNQKARYGIVGANGSGKSTLLRLLSGEEELKSGTIEKPNKATVGFLKQDHFKYEQTLILEVVLQGNQILWGALKEKEELLHKPQMTESEGYRLADLEAIISEQDGYTAETRAHQILVGLGIPLEKHLEEMHILSGGFKLRVLMAQTLFSNPDILLLDEPTNHLDIVAIQWLENFLVQEYKGVLLTVSHDVTFLNNLTTHILDVDYGTVRQYTGNFDAFLVSKALEEEQRLIEQKEGERKIAHLQSFVDRFKAKASKARQAQSRVKMIDKIEMPEILTSSRRAPHFQFESRRPSGKQVVKVKNICKSYGDLQVLNKVSLDVARGEKVAIIGPNGIGKSTLLKIILDQVKPDSGEFEWGYETHVGYFAQDHHEQLCEPQTVMAWANHQAPSVDEQTIRRVLGGLLFSQDDIQKLTTSLSGGEAARLLFAAIRLNKGNVLVLDEPTNHLDMESIEALAKALRAYEGTVLMVSHDRHFIEAVCDRVILVTEKGIKTFSESSGASIAKICEEHFLAKIA